MKSTFTEMEEFKKVSSRIDKQLRDLKKEKQKAQQEIDDIDEQYKELIDDEAVTGEKLDKNELNRLTEKKNTPNRTIAQAEDRITVLEEKEEELLKELIPGLHEGYRKKMAEFKQEIEGRIDGITPKVAELLDYLSEIGRINTLANRVHYDFISQTRKVDDTHYDRARFWGGILNLDYADRLLFGNPNDVEERRGVSKNDQINALRHGSIPSSIALYNLTGEVEPRQLTASQKYSKAKRAEKEEVKNITKLCEEKSAETITQTERDYIALAVNTLTTSSELFIKGWESQDVGDVRSRREKELQLPRAYKTMDKYGITDEVLASHIKNYQKELRYITEILEKQTSINTSLFLGEQRKEGE